jgi:hypothetical protein
MPVYEKEAKEALDSMKKVLEKINEKLNDEDILGDLVKVEQLRIKKIWIKEKIQEWEEFNNQ